MADKTGLKSFSGFEIKNAELGEVEAIIATLGVVDRDGDIIRPTAFQKGAKVTMSRYGHDAVFGNQPVGKGALSVSGKHLVFNGKLFLGTAAGRETFEVLKEMGHDQQWSFGFRVLGSEVPSEAERKQGAVAILTKLDPFEVSPVLEGAGIGTRTLAMKSAVSQADGTDEDQPVEPPEKVPGAPELNDAELKSIANRVAGEILATKAAEKAAATAAAEAEAKAAEDARAAEAEAERVRVAGLATKEFDRFQATLKRQGVLR